MAYQRTQIYLDPEEHRRLVREAGERGLSLTEHLRRVIGARAHEPPVAYDVHAWDGLFALADAASSPSGDTDDEAAQAFEEEHERSLRRRRTTSRASRAR